MSAGLKPGVVYIPDEQVAFPEPNPLPNQPPQQSPIDSEGQLIINGFTIEELIMTLGATGSYTESTGVSSIRYPVILQGAAPPIGTVVLVGESKPIFGKIVSQTLRSDYTLVQLEHLPLPEVFSRIDLSFNAQTLIDSGIVEKDYFYTDPIEPEFNTFIDGSPENQSANPSRKHPTNPTCMPTFTQNGIEIKLVESTLEFNPVLELDVTIDDGDQITCPTWMPSCGKRSVVNTVSHGSIMAR